jgi:N-acyl-D-amino-acid deacylase
MNRSPTIACRWYALALTAAVFLVIPAHGEDTPITGRADPRLADIDRFMVAFVHDHQVPGASLAIARNGRMVYSRGFGFADVAAREPVAPDSLFRIASISKPFTSAAIFQLIERGKLKLDDKAFEFTGIQPHLEAGAKVDPRLWHVTIAELLHHTGGFDRDKSFDPMFRPIDIARAVGVPPPAKPRDIIEYMMGRPLDFDPGTCEAYSNFGYCVLGRVIEKASGMSYADYVTREVLAPLGIRRMRIGHTLENERAEGEVRYYPRDNKQVNSVFDDGKQVPLAYGGWYIEAMDSHGAWIASAPQLVRFASSLDDPARCPILKARSIAAIFARPKDTGYDAAGKPKAAYYACGWEVRPIENGKSNTWHAGLLDGTSTLLVRRFDGFTWAVLFNTESDANNKDLADIIDPQIHGVVDGIKSWPQGWEFDDGTTVKGPSLKK